MSALSKDTSGKKVVPGISRKENCLDNAPMESFFGALKAECFYLQKLCSAEQLQDAIDEYIHYYKHSRAKLIEKTEPC
jgi:putative transposase